MGAARRGQNPDGWMPQGRPDSLGRAQSWKQSSFRASVKGTCRVCGEGYEAGDYIQTHPGGGAQHPRCAGGAPSPASDRDEGGWVRDVDIPADDRAELDVTCSPLPISTVMEKACKVCRVNAKQPCKDSGGIWVHAARARLALKSWQRR